MPKKKVVPVLHTPAEIEELKRELPTGASPSNYYRSLRGLPPLTPGPPKGSQHTKGKRWKQKQNRRWRLAAEEAEEQ
jgi:hypothetical protein